MAEKEYIEREALNAAIHESWGSNPHNNPIARQTHNHEHRHFLGLLHKQPAADVVEVRHGVWFWRDNNDRSYTLCCSACNETEGARETAKYCSNCGAIMDGATDICVGAKWTERMKIDER
jgi:hypothetical protein